MQIVTPDQKVFLVGFMIEFAKWFMLGIISWGLKRVRDVIKEIPTRKDLAIANANVKAYFEERMVSHETLDNERFGKQDRRQDMIESRLEAIKVQIEDKFQNFRKHSERNLSSGD